MPSMFPFGHIVMTPGAAALHVDFAPYLTRHGLGDWGELCDFDAEQNDTAVQHGGRLLSAYTVPLGDGCSPSSSGRMRSGSARTSASLPCR
jgi:hypothetical protein